MIGLRIILAIMLIGSLVGLSALDFAKGDWRTGVIGCLFAAANILIFLVKT